MCIRDSRSCLARLARGTAQRARAGAVRPPACTSAADECIPPGAHELDLFLVGAGARELADADGAAVGVLNAARAQAVCAGRYDFVSFEQIEEAVAAGTRVVVAAQRGDRSMRSAQGYLAASLRRWLLELKRDGAGRALAETRNVDPITRRQFTRAQVIAVLLFGTEQHTPSAQPAPTGARGA